MSTRSARERAGRTPLWLALGAFAIAFAQRPGQDTAETKVNLHVDPIRFLSELVSVWSPTEGLGHVQGGQYSGYLWPMGPFFALGRALGLSDWVTERLWLGALLALAAWGAVRLTDALLDRRRGIAHAVAGAVFMVNPYVVVFTARTTIFLLAYAALPWLMLIAHRGLATPRRWWWPAAFALVTTSSGGGVNATVTALVLLGPILLVLYELRLGDASPADAWALFWRTALATAVASLWWIAPLLVQSGYGLNFLQFTEQVGAIWATTSLSESLRLMGYWPSYLGTGYATRLQPYYADAGTLLFDLWAVVPSLLVPALALGGYIWTRRWRYGPFLLALALSSLLVMSVGYPTGTLARSGVTFIYNRVSALQFLRTTYKAGPLLALAVAMLAAAAARALSERLRGWRGALAATAGTALVVLAALPLFQGRALELTFSRIPAAWTQAGQELDAALPRNSRAIVLPGQAYAFYRWGATIDPILTATTTRPVAIRNVPPYDDLHAVDFLWTVDDLVQQQRLLPGQLGPLLDLMSARMVVTGSDDDTAASGALSPAAAAAELRLQAGLGPAAHSYGPSTRFPSPPGTADPAVRLPQVRIYDTPARGLVRVEPQGPATVVDGSAQGVADLAALHQLPPAAPLFYAGDESAAQLRAEARAGADVVITDSNQRRAFVASRVGQDTGWTVAASDPLGADAAQLDPFPARGSAAQTVAVFTGVRDIRAPYNPEIAQFPAQSPYAAFDGNPATAWQADPTLGPGDHWIEVDFDAPRDVTSINLLPDQTDPLVRLSQVAIDGRTYGLHRGWNHLILGLRRVSSLRIELVQTRSLASDTGSAGGLAEVQIPGVRAEELLRPPLLVEQALRGQDLRHTPLSYVLTRSTADAPLQRGPAPTHEIVHGDRLSAEATLIAQAQDAETGISRVLDPPAARAWTLAGLATLSPVAPDPAVDRLAGGDLRGATFSSSGRLEGLARFRASSAFDASPTTAWAAPIGPYQPAWIAWTTPRRHTLRHLTLIRSTLPVRFPTQIAVSVAGAPAQDVAVGPTGIVTLLRPLRGASFRIAVLHASGSSRPAVGIAAVRGAGIPTVAPRTSGRILGRCGDARATVGGRAIRLRLSGSVADLNAGEPLQLQSCGRPVALPASTLELQIPATAVRPLVVALRSPAPSPLALPAEGIGGRVISSGHLGDDGDSAIRVSVTRPSWLVFGESYDRGWQASCNGHSLGPPRVIDGFANGWRIRPGCRSVSIAFGPQSEVQAGYFVGALACALLLGVLLLTRPGAAGEAGPVTLSVAVSLPRLSPARAVAVGLLCAAAFGFVFALRAGAVIGPACGVLLWRGAPIRRLLQAAAALLVIVVPALYVLFPGVNLGGYDTGYAVQHLAAHWTTVGAFALLVLALARDLSTATAHPGGGRGRRRAAGHRRRARA